LRSDRFVAGTEKAIVRCEMCLSRLRLQHERSTEHMRPAIAERIATVEGILDRAWQWRRAALRG
jgi:hypothetical protein